MKDKEIARLQAKIEKIEATAEELRRQLEGGRGQAKTTVTERKPASALSKSATARKSGEASKPAAKKMSRTGKTAAKSADKAVDEKK